MNEIHLRKFQSLLAEIDYKNNVINKYFYK